MEVTCTICKHYSRTMEAHERHTQTDAHKTNAEIYQNGIEAGEYKSASRIAELEAALLSIRYYVNNPSAWSNYDEMVSETMRDALKAARLLDGDK